MVLLMVEMGLRIQYTCAVLGRFEVVAWLYRFLNGRFPLHYIAVQSDERSVLFPLFSECPGLLSHGAYSCDWDGPEVLRGCGIGKELLGSNDG